MFDVMEVVGKELNPIFSSCTYMGDKPLIKKLGLKTFRNIPSWEKVELGEVRFSDDNCEYDVKVKITVEVCPAQFYEFDITVKPAPNVKGEEALKHFRITTGSGCFADYWEKLSPLFKRMSEGMIVVKGGKA